MQTLNCKLTRTQIHLTVAQKNALSAMAREQSCSRGALIREAIDDYIRAGQLAKKLSKRMAAAGIWQPNPDVPNLHQLRREERSF